jgi:hypothetical protein
MNKRTVRFIFGSFVLCIVGFSVSSWLQSGSAPGVNPPPVSVQTQSNTFSYSGVTGKDALALLQEKTNVVQDKAGLVIAINGRKADNAKKEYWAFYVQGKMAQIGPKEYVTKDGDTIEWKIEKY